MRLQPHHRQYHMVTNLLVSDAEELPTKEIEARVRAYNEDPTEANRERAVLAFGSVIRHMVGRYIGTFRSIKSMEDDLVSQAYMSVLHSIDSGTEADDSCRVISNRVLRTLTEYVNKYRTASAPTLRYQLKRVNRGEDVLYAVPIAKTHDQPEEDYSLMEYEFLSALLDSDLTEIEKKILDPDHWGLTIDEMARRLEMPPQTLGRHFNRLVEKARQLLYAD